MDDAAILKTVLFDVVLHDMVVMVGVYAYIPVFGESVIHNVAKHMAHIRVAGDTVDHMIRLFVIEPLAFVYLFVCRPSAMGAE